MAGITRQVSCHALAFCMQNISHVSTPKACEFVKDMLVPGSQEHKSASIQGVPARRGACTSVVIVTGPQGRLRAAEGAGPRAGRPGPGVPRAHPARVGAVQAREERGLRGQARGHRRDIRVVARQALAQGQGACHGLSVSAVECLHGLRQRGRTASGLECGRVGTVHSVVQRRAGIEDRGAGGVRQVEEPAYSPVAVACSRKAAAVACCDALLCRCVSGIPHRAVDA